MKNTTGGPAFPSSQQSVVASGQGGILDLRKDKDYAYVEISHGMSIRDYFAAKALVGQLTTLANQDEAKGFSDSCSKNNISREDAIARISYALADAMIKERAR